MRAPQSDPVVGKHGEVEIKLDADGIFWTSLSPDKILRDKTRKGLEKKIDDFQRFLSREALANLPVVVLVREGNRWRDEGKPIWYEGNFQGLNAHTGEVAILLNNGKRITVGDSARFFRPNDRRLERVRELVKTDWEVSLAAERASDVAQVALDEAGTQLRRHRGSRSKATDATEAEADLVRFLKGE